MCKQIFNMQCNIEWSSRRSNLSYYLEESKGRKNIKAHEPWKSLHVRNRKALQHVWRISQRPCSQTILNGSLKWVMLSMNQEFQIEKTDLSPKLRSEAICRRHLLGLGRGFHVWLRQRQANPLVRPGAPLRNFQCAPQVLLRLAYAVSLRIPDLTMLL